MVPTPYIEVNAVLAALLSGVQRILGDDLLGMYIYGSLASGDFNPLTSDIDFLAVTRARGEANALFASPLCELHAQLIAGGNPWASRLEGAYIPLETLRHPDPAAPAFPCTNEGKFYLAQMEDDWAIRRHLLLKAAIVLAGPPVQEFIDPASPEELRRAVSAFLYDWWQPMIERSPSVPFRLDTAEYQRYAVLTMCRILNTLRTGEFLSKAAAGRWALQTLDSRWQPLIQRALDWQPDEEMDALEEIVALIHFTADSVQNR